MAKKSWKKGKFDPLNREKYRGSTPIVYRSSWELKFMHWCDRHCDVVEWSSESIKIPYFNPLKNTQSIYVPDFTIKYKDRQGNIHQELVEIKPYDQTVASPKASKAKRLVIAVNHAKWKAAMKWCKYNGFDFRILTEREIYGTIK